MEANTINTACPIKFTDGAIKEVKMLFYEKELSSEHALRVAVEGGGCSGLSYKLGFDKAKETDFEYEVGGFKVLMDKTHGMYLAGMEIDYVNGLKNRGFIFNNPNAKDTCGCGESFST